MDSRYGPALREAAQRQGLNFVGPQLHGSLQEPEYRRVILAIADAGAQALLASDQSENIANRGLISELAMAARLPAMYAYPEFVSSGGLMAYGIKLSEAYRGAAGQIDQILRGTKPGEFGTSKLPSSSSPSTSKPQKRSASKSRQMFSHAPMRSSNREAVC